MTGGVIIQINKEINGLIDSNIVKKMIIKLANITASLCFSAVGLKHSLASESWLFDC